MHETEFPTSKRRSAPGLDGQKQVRALGFAWFRTIWWIVLLFSLLMCSCTTPQRHTISVTGDNPAALVNDAPAPATRININTASAVELEALPGVGKVLAERIVAHREQNGHFRRSEHLMMVRGFSDHKFRAVRERVTVD